jgi:hypothetical protein
VADDRPAEDIRSYAPGHHRVGIPRQRPARKSGALRDPVTGRVQFCELHDDSRAGGGWDVTMLQDEELLFSGRCVDGRGARYVAEAFKQDTLRAGWSE